MQWLAEICVRRPVFAVMLVMAFVVAGAASFLQLGVDRYPNMDLPTITVRTSYLGAASQEIESEITQILEDAVATVAGIEELRSISADEQSLLLITFNLNRDIDAATQDVRDAINAVLNRLPPNTDPPVIRKQDLDSSPVISIALAGPRTARELYILADRFVKNAIESAPGVGQVGISGATDRAIRVEIDARRLAAYGLSIIDVREALARQNAEVPGGRVDAGHRELTLRTMGRFETPKDFEQMVVKTVNGAAIRLCDLGVVLDTQKEIRSLSRLDGEPAVTVFVQRQSGANTIDVIEEVKKRLAKAVEALPPDVSVEVIQDQSRYIHAAMHEVEQHLVIGSVLCCLVVLLFMRSWRSTLIASVAIPTSIIATFAMMRYLDFTLNNVTMLALVLMVGVVIDDAIVVLENVFHAIEEQHLPPMVAALEGTREIGLAVLATTLSLVVVFLPVSFLSSITGRMLFQFGLTATAAILVSLLVSFSLTPMMCSRMLRAVDAKANEPSSRKGFYHWIDLGYAWCLERSLRFRWVVAVLALAVIGSNVPLYYLVPQDYVPRNVDESEFEIRLSGPEGATLSAMDSAVTQIEKELLEMQGIQHILVSIGSRGLANVSSGEIFVRLDELDERSFTFVRLWNGMLAGDPLAAFRGNFSQREKMTEIRKRLSKFKGVRCSVANLTSLRQGAPVDIDFVIYGPDLMELAKLSDRLAARVRKIPGIVDLDTTLHLDKPQLLTKIDRSRAADLGVDVQEIADTLRVAVGGDDRVSRFRDPALDDAYDVELRLVGIDRSSANVISQLYVRVQPKLAAQPVFQSGSVDTELFPSGVVLTRLDNLVNFLPNNSPARIDRVDRQRMVAVRANIAPGFALGDRIAAVREEALAMGLPLGYGTRVLGRGRELERTLSDFAWTFILSFVFMYIILAAQFEHYVHPLTILLSLPMAVPFGMISLWLGGETLNLYSALGILVLFGVVKKNSILQVDHTNQLRARGLARHAAIMQANRDRLRPILMTTIAFVVGMCPLLLGNGPGAEERRSIAVLAVGGQTLSLLLTLVAVPVFYTFFDDIGAWFAPRQESAALAESTPALAEPQH